MFASGTAANQLTKSASVVYLVHNFDYRLANYDADLR